MSNLVCDICGGKLKVVNGKFAICESCGMEHGIERLQEKYRDAQKVVHTDSAHLLANYFSMAQDLYDAGNKKEAENYCNKILEISPTHTDALILKGKAVGWQFSIDNFRFQEVAICFANAVNSALPETRKKDIHTNIEEEFKGLATAIISARCLRFAKYPDNEEANTFSNDLDEISEAINKYVSTTSFHINKNKVFGNIASTVKLCISTLASTILLNYQTDRSRYAYLDYASKIDNYIEILEKTADLCSDDNDSDLEIYEQIITMCNNVLNNNSLDAIENRWGAYIKTPRLSMEEEENKKKKISEMEEKIKKIKNFKK